MSRNIILSILAVVLFAGITFLGYTKRADLLNFVQKYAQKFSQKESQNQTQTEPQQKPITFGILVPLEHVALKEIVEGFQTEVKQKYPDAVFEVENAQGDIKLQRTIIERFAGEDVDVIVPIGTTATQMTLSFVKTKPIVSLAADYSKEERQKRHPQNITGVLDEIGGKKKLDFITQVLPDIKKITIIFHSGNEKNFKEIQELIDYGKTKGINIQKLSIHTLPELESTVKAIDQDSGAILVLKDHLVVSGIRLLLPTAEERHIPLIAADEGSVQEGATFALAVKERSIGEEGGKLAIQLLQGAEIQALPMEEIQRLVVFYNVKALQKQNIKASTLEQAADKNGYQFIQKP